MTEQQQSPGLDPSEAYATEYRRLWDATVATLTAAVQLDHPQHGPVDIRKPDGQPFLPASRIEVGTRFVFEELRADNHLRSMSRPTFIERLAHHYDALNTGGSALSERELFGRF